MVRLEDAFEESRVGKVWTLVFKNLGEPENTVAKQREFVAGPRCQPG